MLEILLWLNGLILVLVLLVFIALQLPAVQQFAAEKATAYLAEKLHTKVAIGRFTTDWRNSIVLKEIYIEDQQKDTLLYAGRLGLDLNILGTSRERLKVRSVKIDDGMLRIYALPADSSYNFSFISKAFSGSGSDSASNFSLKIGSLHLSNIRFQLDDPIGGNFGKGRIGKFILDADAFDTQGKTYQLGNIKWKNSSVFWRKTKVPDNSTDSGGLDFTFKKIELEDLRFDLRDESLARRLTLQLGKADLRADKIALEEARADLSRFTLENSALKYYKLKPDTSFFQKGIVSKKPESSKKSEDKKDWAVWLQKTSLKNVIFQYQDHNAPVLSSGLDFNNFRLHQLNLLLTNVYYSQGRVSGNLDALQFIEKRGFRVRDLKGKVKAGADFLELKAGVLNTNYSQIRAAISVAFAPLRMQAAGKPFTTFTAQLQNARFSPKDLLFIAPDLAERPALRKLGKNMLVVNGEVSGRANDLKFRNFSLKGWTGTTMKFTGTLKDLQRENSRQMNIQIQSLNTNRRDLNVMASDGTGDPKFGFPERVSLHGTLQSQLNKISFQNLQIKGSNGFILQTNGQFSGPPANREVKMDVKDLAVSRAELLKMLPADAVSPEVQLPDQIRYVGTYQGKSLEKFALNGNFNTTFGKVYANIKIEPVQQFSGHVSLDNFDLGKFLKQEKMLGPATGKADFQGKGYKLKTMKLHYDADVKRIVYQGETYHNLRLEGNLNQKIYQLNGNLANAALQGLGHKLKKIKPKNLNLKKADPTRLIPKKVEAKKLVPKFLKKKKSKEEQKQ